VSVDLAYALAVTGAGFFAWVVSDKWPEAAAEAARRYPDKEAT